MTLTHYGFREWFSATLAAIAGIAVGVLLIMHEMCTLGAIVIFVSLLCWVAIAGFFRSPKRTLPADINLLVSPADGTVKDIEVVEVSYPGFNGKAKRVGIFLSVFNVHVNRAPAEWEVIGQEYRKGKFLDARDVKCITENEAMTLYGSGKIGDYSFPMAVRQISGAIARRIVCPVKAGTHLKRGKIYGMIKFGSRTELYLPCTDEFDINVKIGDKVRGGITILATRSVK